MLQNQNFDLVAGNTRTLTFTVKDKSTGAVVDLTGATLSWAMARTVNDAADVTKTTSSGIAVDTPTSGVAVVTLNPSDTSDLTTGDYYHDLQVTDSSGRVSTVASGRARLRAGISRS